MDRVKWAVIGAGGIARRRTIPEGIVPASNATLVAVMSPQSGESVASEFEVSCAATVDDLLTHDIDAVYVATPTHLHCEQVVRAASAGKHVLCEKPMAMNVEQAQRMLAACEESGVKLGLGFMMRFHPCHREAQRLLKDEALGRPVFGRAQLSCWYPPMDGAWRQDPALGGGGSLADLGAHCIDLLEMCFGRARRVACMTGRTVHGYESEDTATVMLGFEHGVQGIVDCLFNVPDDSSLNRLELYGTRGSILAEGTIGQGSPGTMTLRTKDSVDGYQAEQARDQTAGVTITPDPVNVYREQIEAFSNAILQKHDPPISGRDGVWNQRVLDACYESAKTGKTVELQTNHNV